MKVKFNVNSKMVELETEPNQTLLETLRQNDYTEVKCGCNEGECGACLVILDGKPVNSCQVLSMSVQKKKIKTVKGIGTLHYPHMIQESFVEAGADQCGFCSPGMVLSTYALLKNNHEPSDQEILEAFDGNLCRCTGYVKIIDAVKIASKKIQANNKKQE